VVWGRAHQDLTGTTAISPASTSEQADSASTLAVAAGWTADAAISVAAMATER